MSGSGFRGVGTSDTVRGASGGVVLPSSQLVVRVVEDRGMVFLDAHSRLGPARSLRLDLAHRPLIEGIASFTPLGRLQALCWGLTFGVGNLPHGALVRFESGTLRHPTSARSAVRRLDHDCWVSDAEGVFSWGALLVDGQEQARTRLTPESMMPRAARTRSPPSAPLRMRKSPKNTDHQPGDTAGRQI